MKTLKLNQMAANAIDNAQMSKLKGGDCSCGCGCLYANSGGSSTSSNASANMAGGKFSNHNYLVYCDGVWENVPGGVPINSDWMIATTTTPKLDLSSSIASTLNPNAGKLQVQL
ncbi:hypothetical protein FACS189429_6320 [Bacteroidia bacterium]|nr:hypothetical protein FACS189429_6320 [Bacteroidia bacterium]GHV44333.1 hypothetical protein FACS1894180_5540 [Bacteroidia bacterium]